MTGKLCKFVNNQYVDFVDVYYENGNSGEVYFKTESNDAFKNYKKGDVVHYSDNECMHNKKYTVVLVNPGMLECN